MNSLEATQMGSNENRFWILIASVCEQLSASNTSLTPQIIHWVKQLGQRLQDAPQERNIPEVGELDQPQTYVRSKKTLIWLWTAVNNFAPGIRAGVLGARTARFQTIVASC